MMHTISEQYRKKHPSSERLFQQAKELFPGGVTHDRRYLTPFSIYMTHGEGARKWDVDGNEYIDYAMGHGALILGHSHPEIVLAVKEQISKGTHLGACTQAEMRWAEAVKALIPSIEKIRFHSSGTEATIMAMRLARAYTGKSRIIKFKNHFHGWQDYAVIGNADYSSPGIPREVADTMIVLPDGDIDLVEKTLKENKDIAALILEPTGGRAGTYPLKPEFIRWLRQITEKYGVVLIFDEIVTGFRISPGGAQERFGIKPDLTVLAKILAGGLPGGAVGGKKEIMDMITFRNDPDWDKNERISHPGTFNANPLSAAAGTRCLELIANRHEKGGSAEALSEHAYGAQKTKVYSITDKAEESAKKLREELNLVLKHLGVSALVYGLGSTLHIAFGIEYDGDLDYCTVSHNKIKDAMSSEVIPMFRKAMLNEGVDVFGGNWLVLSAAHGDKELEQTAEAFENALVNMKKEGIA